MKPVRCAIYTGKASEEGLEQDVNSRHAQREACSAYILSQASEGWMEIKDAYDDGGCSGGTLVRPALRRLLDDVSKGKIDIIIVYKVDRLTRSLLDFAKLIDVFDKAGTSFVSVTQSFNTTNSMGRLTLNMLLSFAQFEREVTAERIRDKVAASKAKGMWMGGNPPLGYRPDGRTLAIVEEHATIIRDIFNRYLILGAVRLVADQLKEEGIRTPARNTLTGRSYGERTFSRGQIAFILKNPVYCGMISHKDRIFKGLHQPIIQQDIWQAVQVQLEQNRQGGPWRRSPQSSLLSGLIFDLAGEPLVATHTSKGARRYRYYVSKSYHFKYKEASSSARNRLPAREIERFVTNHVASFVEDPWGLPERASISLTPQLLSCLPERCAALAAQVRHMPISIIPKLVERICVSENELSILLSRATLFETLQIEANIANDEPIVLRIKMQIKSTGRANKLVRDNGRPINPAAPDPWVMHLLACARRWWATLSTGSTNIKALSRLEGVSSSYMTRVVRLAFLAPSLVEALLDGTAVAGVDGSKLIATNAVDILWERQNARYLGR